MIGWIVRLCLLALWLVVLLIVVGVQLEYGQAGFIVRVRVGPSYIRVYPSEKKEKKQGGKSVENSQPKPEQAQEEPPKKKGGVLRFVLDFLPPILRTVKQLCGELWVDKLELVLTAGADDPGDAALQYGGANALLGSLWHPIVDTCRVVDGRARVEVDFQAKSPSVYLLCDLTLRGGQLLVLTVLFFVRLIAYRRQKKQNSDLN